VDNVASLKPDRVMVCMSSNARAPRVIATGAHVAHELGAPWYAVYVETPPEHPGRIRRIDAAALRDNIALSGRLGATVVRVHAQDVAEGLVAFAKREGITHAVFGASERSRLETLWKGSTIGRFLLRVPDAAVQIVPLEEPLRA
jgi:two-component system, OmpR family, sensor histidine kinase KdpD